MSDYLGNLIARTLSPAAVVRPQLPSLFEPAPANRRSKSEFELDQETFSEPPPITRRTETAAPHPPSVLTPRQSVLSEPESTSITSAAKTPVPTPPSILAPRQSVVREPERITPPPISRSQGILHAAEDPEPSSADIVLKPAIRWDESKSTPGRSETNVAPFTPEPRKNNSRAGHLESRSRGSRDNVAPTAISQLSTPDSQPKKPTLVRPDATVQKLRAVEAVVPVIRSLPQFPPAPKSASAPTINVTIGRVEIRATSPAAPQRARPKSANVLSLEDYLRQRTKGGGR
jgi:hypothetical protein